MLNVVVLASGRGSNFAALCAAEKRGELSIRLRALLSDRGKAPALDLARNAGITAESLSPRDYPDRASFDRALFARAAEFLPDLIVLTGFMRIIDATVIEQWRGRIINIHPSLLPRYPGLRTHARALEAGDSVHGASVHFVTPELDGGPVIAQVELPILPGDDVEGLAARLLLREHVLLVATVNLLAQGRAVLGADGIALDGRELQAPLKLAENGVLRSC